MSSIPTAVSRRAYSLKRTVTKSLYSSIQHPLRKISHRKLIETNELEEIVSDKSIHHFGKPEEYNPDFGEHEWLVEYTGKNTPGSFPQPFVCVLEDVRLWGRYPLPLVESFRIPLDALVNQNIFDLTVFASTMYAPRDVLSVPLSDGVDVETGFLLYNFWSKGFFHWHFDNLIQLRGVEQFESQTGTKPSLIVSPNLSSWQLETLEIMGFDEDDLVPWNSPTGRVDQLVVVTNQRPRPQAVRWLRDALELPDSSSSDENRIYVSRADAKRRRVLNEEAVVECLDEYGFTRFVPGEHSIREQIATMSNAEVVVGPHGAGLANLLHCPEETKVLELMPESDIRGHFFNLSYKLGLEYACCLCESSAKDILVDVDQLEEELTALLDD